MAQQVKDLELLQLRLRFNLWLGNFRMLWAQSKEEKKKKHDDRQNDRMTPLPSVNDRLSFQVPF